jgi:hypothetical protein
MGVSPALVEELCLTAGIAPAASPDSLSPEAWRELHTAWQAWLENLHTGNFTPSSCPATGKFSVIGSYSQPHDSVHDMVEGYYRSLQAGEVYAGLHQRLGTAVKQALKKARGRVKSFEQQLQAADEVAAVQKQADIIVANIYRWGVQWVLTTSAVCCWGNDVQSSACSAVCGMLLASHGCWVMQLFAAVGGACAVIYLIAGMMVSTCSSCTVRMRVLNPSNRTAQAQARCVVSVVGRGLQHWHTSPLATSHSIFL